MEVDIKMWKTESDILQDGSLRFANNRSSEPERS